MFNRGLEELLTHHIKTTQMCLEEIIALKKKDNELTEQLIRMEGRIELGMEHAEMSNIELHKRIADSAASTFVTKEELAGLVKQIEHDKDGLITSVKVGWIIVAAIWTVVTWMVNKGIIHV